MGKPGVCFCLRGRTLWSGQECKEPLPVQNGHWKIDFIQRLMFMDKKSNSSWWKSWEMYWHEKRACQAVVTAIYQPLGENGEQRSGWWFAQIHTIMTQHERVPLQAPWNYRMRLLLIVYAKMLVCRNFPASAKPLVVAATALITTTYLSEYSNLKKPEECFRICTNL